RVLAGEGVVGAERASYLVRRVVAEREVEERHRPGLAVAARGAPRLAVLLAARREVLRPATAGRPPVAELRGAAERDVDRAADEHARAAARPDAALAVPEAP